MMNVFIFRINCDDDDCHNWIIDELKQGRLRQGWGHTGMSISNNGIVIPFEKWKPNFPEEWVVDESTIPNRYGILCRMLDIQAGDLLVVPKTTNSWTFSIAKAKKEYSFDEIGQTKWDDFRHLIEVSDVKEFPYSSSPDAKYISSKFRAYQTAVNNVYKTDIIETCQRLYVSNVKSVQKSDEQLWNEIIEESIRESHKRICERITPQDFERLIVKCLTQNGYQILRRNEYDRKGADIDILAYFNPPIFTEHIDNLESKIEFLIQIKKKSGRDSDFKAGIKQLVSSRKNGLTGELILINTTDEISEEDHLFARANDVKIVDGVKIIKTILTTKFNSEATE